MPITADKVRELAARGEGPTLDFKRSDHDWAANKSAANAELSKDLMALANKGELGGEGELRWTTRP